MIAEKLVFGLGETPQGIALRYGNRHGLVAGATGTGKTVTLQVLAEGFSRAGVPVFCADVKGDLSGLAAAGEANPKLDARAAELGAEGYKPQAVPVAFWDLAGERGHPVRTTISEMGPVLLSRLLELNEVQEGVLNIAFRVADDEGLLLLDLKDLRALLKLLAETRKEVGATYGNVSPASVGAIQRRLLVLEQQGAEKFFGEPALDLNDLMRTTFDGQGFVNVLVADELMRSPRLYSTFLLWLLSELFEELPEVGDPDKPKLVFFFDEAHLLFDDAPKALLDQVEQVVRLIRSKGVGVYFVTQNPIDVPPTVLGQLGNRVQHALRAFTPRDQKAVKVAAETFRPNPAFETEDVITLLNVGEALVSTLEDKGAPSVVQRAKIFPPRSRMGPITEDERAGVMSRSPVAGKYDVGVDNESAHEILQKRAAERMMAEAEAEVAAKRGNVAAQNRRQPEAGERQAADVLRDMVLGTGRRQGIAETMAKQVARTVASQVGRQLVRGLLGGLLKR